MASEGDRRGCPAGSEARISLIPCWIASDAMFERSVRLGFNVGP